MKTVCVMIGNSDNKLSQREWSEFCKDLRSIMGQLATETHFDATSEGSHPWQNLCVVAQIEDLDFLRLQLSHVAAAYGQDSVAILVGETQFVEANK